MSRFTATSLFTLAVLFAALAIPAAAQACSCVGPSSPKDVAPFYAKAIKRSDGAIIGVVKKVETVANDPGVLGDETAIFTVRVRRTFKHRRRIPEGSRVELRTSASGASCGLELGVGDRAGLLLYRDHRRLSANLCGQIKPRWMKRGAARLQRSAPAGSESGCAAV